MRAKGVWLLAVMWTVVVALSLLWNVFQEKQQLLETAHIQARAAYEKDIIYRLWNARHGGVYVPVSEKTQPNPLLGGMTERDITTPSGRQLTLMNPAYMTRQMYELSEEEFGVYGHITSLNPIRPENAPDPWEKEALRAFEYGEKEISSVEEMKGEEYMRLMRPLITEKECLKCHAEHGYEEGDIRGGISVSISLGSLRAIARERSLTFGLGHLFLWFMGLGGIVLGTQRLRRKESDRRLAVEALQKAKNELSMRVEERTFELKTANEQLGIEITERKRAEGKIRKANRELEQRVKGRTAELQKTVNLMAGREARMKELKSVIEKLQTQLESAGMKPTVDDPLKETGSKES